MTLQVPITKVVTGEPEASRMQEVLQSGWLTQGPATFEFERLVCEFVGAAHAVAMNSATTALHVACVLAELGPGDEVILPSYTHIATANSVRYTGATPVFVDIEPSTFNIDATLIEDAITPRTKAIMPVPQVGNPLDYDAINAIATRRGLKVIEDAACALGSEYHGRRVGSMGHPTVFSFHPRKIITTGEGGMLLLPDQAQATLARSLASHGESVLDIDRHSSASAIQESFPRLGYNYRLTNLQGALGVAQMMRLESVIEGRRARAARYDDLLADIEEVTSPAVVPDRRQNYQSYMIRINGRHEGLRDHVMARLREAGIASRPGVMAVHREPIYEGYARSPLPETERAIEEALILPLFPQMTDAEQDHVISSLRAALAPVRS